jgi:hypothetical protein
MPPLIDARQHACDLIAGDAENGERVLIAKRRLHEKFRGGIVRRIIRSRKEGPPFIGKSAGGECAQNTKRAGGRLNTIHGCTPTSFVTQ